MRHIRKPLLDPLRRRSEAAAIDNFTVLVESAVMAPDISEVDADRRGRLGLSLWDFRDEVLRWLLRERSGSFFGGPAHPIHTNPISRVLHLRGNNTRPLLIERLPLFSGCEEGHPKA